MTTRTKRKPLTRAQRDALRTAVADYMSSEGCSCCRDTDAHDEHRAVLGKLLSIRPEPDGMGDGGVWYDFSPFRSASK